MPGRRTLKREAPMATARMQKKRRGFSECQWNRAYGSRGRPKSNWVRINAIAGRPRDTPLCIGLAKNLFKLFPATRASTCSRRGPIGLPIPAPRSYASLLDDTGAPFLIEPAGLPFCSCELSAWSPRFEIDYQQFLPDWATP